MVLAYVEAEVGHTSSVAGVERQRGSAQRPATPVDDADDRPLDQVADRQRPDQAGLVLIPWIVVDLRRRNLQRRPEIP